MIVRRPREDDGSILPLVAFAVAFALVLVFLASAATSLYLERKRLLTVADGAALVGAEAFGLGDVRAAGSRLVFALEDEAVRAAVEDYVAGVPADAFDRLRLESAASLDGSSATVSLSADWHPPIVTLFVPDGFRIDVTSTARSVFG